MKRLITLILFILGTMSIAQAQRTITGTLTDNNGEALIGASVLVEGTSAGTVTDLDGKFSLVVPEGGTNLVCSYTGFATQTVEIGASNILDVVLEESALTLDLVVVTATGLVRNARDVTYANQTVDGDDLLSAPNKNALEALRGKVAGVKLSTGSGSVGASTRIVLRGEGSLTGDNNALIVVDGIVIDNATSRGGETGSSGRAAGVAAENGYADYGNRFNDINPEDIESITVLKGPSATSLYGSRGASGVLLITTKKGAAGKGKMKVGINSTTSFEQAYVLFQRQDQYGQGYMNLPGPPQSDSGENWSWGPAFDGVVRPWTSPVDVNGDGKLEFLSRPYSAVPNQLENFFRTGATYTNSINLQGGTDMLTYYVSYSNTTQDGILENTDYKRNTVKFAATANLSERLSSSFSVSYANVNQNSSQEGSRAFEGQNAYANAVQAPVNIPYNELRDYKSPYHDFKGFYGSYTVNPYYVLNEYINNGVIDNFLGNISLTYNVLAGLDLTARVGANVVSRTIRTATPQYQYEPHYFWADNLEIGGPRGGRQGSPGAYAETAGTNTNLDITGLANYTRDLTQSGDINMTITGGWNRFTRDTRSVTGQTSGGIVVPEFYNLSNSVGIPLATQNITEYQINGLFGNAQFGYKNMLFLEYSARNDWSSTLPKANNSFFYQSVGVSFVVSELFANPVQQLDFLKIRGSVGTTGKDAALYALNSTFLANPVLQPLSNGHDLTFPLNGQAGFTLDNAIGNPDLKPELTTTYEFGVDATFLGERVDLAYTYYSSKHTNQLVTVTLAPSSGFLTTVRNLGEISNKGHELALTLKPIKGLVKGLGWDLTLLWATNTNKVIEILDPAIDDEVLVLAQVRNISVVAQEGLPYGTYKGVVIRTNEAGQTVVDANGNPRLSDDEFTKGSYQPKYIASIGSGITYKGFLFNFLFDFKEGGQFVSTTQFYTEFNGTAVTTTANNRGLFVVPNSVVENEDGTYSPNTTETDMYNYIKDLPFTSKLVDASYVKLREIGLSYTLPKNLIADWPISNLTVGLFAKNVKFWLPDDNVWADPEINGPALTGNAQGIETTQTPPSKSYGIRIGVEF